MKENDMMTADLQRDLVERLCRWQGENVLQARWTLAVLSVFILYGVLPGCSLYNHSKNEAVKGKGDLLHPTDNLVAVDTGVP